MIEHRGTMDGAARRFAIVISRYGRIVSRHLVEGAVEGLRQAGCPDDNVEIFWVPGSFELPVVVRRVAESGRFDAIIGLGCIVRGQTHHNELIASEVAGGFARTAQETGVPVVLGVITAETQEQALERAGLKSNGRGWECAQTAVEMANLMHDLSLESAPPSRAAAKKSAAAKPRTPRVRIATGNVRAPRRSRK